MIWAGKLGNTESSIIGTKGKTDMLYMRIFRIGKDFEHFNLVEVIELLVIS